MEVLRISGGHRFHLKHGPSQEIRQLKKPAVVAFSPRGLRYLKPRILVNEGDIVELGQPIVEHKKDARIKFTSPAAGKIHEVRYGPRRVLEAVVITVDDEAEEKARAGKRYSQEDILGLSKETVERLLLDNGFFGYFDCFPGWGLAPLSTVSTEEKSSRQIVAIHINLLRTEAHFPDPMIVIKDRIAELTAGLVALSRLGTEVRIYVPKGSVLTNELNKIAKVIEVENIYPAENLGVQAWYAGGLKNNQCVIGTDAELLIDIGYLLLRGLKRTERIYSLAGNAIKNPQHIKGRIGMAVGDLTSGMLTTTEDVRLIAGGIFRGDKVRFQDFVGTNDLSIIGLVEDKKRIPFSFFRLGADRLTMTRTWMSGFNKGIEREATTNNNGEERACIQCGYCIDVCPVKLMPNLIMKASMIKDIEKMEWLSINDCVDCGLCTFVCPSKIELGTEIDAGKKLIEKEG